MDIKKCRNCKNYGSYFNTCHLYCREIYLDNGEVYMQPINIKHVDSDECEFEEANKYKQCLEEIKTLRLKEMCGNCTSCDFNANRTRCEKCRIEVINSDDILKLISEVINERN